MRTSVLRSWFPQFLSLPGIVKQEMDFVSDWKRDPDVFLIAKQETGLAQQQILPINSIGPVPTTVSTAILLAPYLGATIAYMNGKAFWANLKNDLYVATVITIYLP